MLCLQGEEEQEEEGEEEQEEEEEGEQEEEEEELGCLAGGEHQEAVEDDLLLQGVGGHFGGLLVQKGLHPDLLTPGQLQDPSP